MGVCVACVGCVWGVCVGACVLGRVWRGGGDHVEMKYCSPLYYPDTLVNPDTCLGILLLHYCKVIKIEKSLVVFQSPVILHSLVSYLSRSVTKKYF